MGDFHGFPCWYELTTPDPVAAGDFYGTVIGWSCNRAPMEGFDYYLGSMGEAMVSGMVAPQAPGIPPNWMIYFAVTDCDASVAGMQEDGAQIVAGPADIPGTGRFAILQDPAGGHFGLLQPPPDGTGGAYAPQTAGHGAWHELMSTDPDAAALFYAKHLGLTESRAMDMGPMGSYRILAVDGTELGGLMRQPIPGMPSFWLPYFTVPSVDAAIAAISGAGGEVKHGPAEVPGGAFIAQATDPQGAWFAVTGPR
ncbi:VOC family protein [Cereibacter sphaeroides]|nr:VOC family protein [Cereibacter sphaeroides]